MTEKKDQDSTQENFWDAMRRGAALAQGWPSWMKGGINLNERNFVTFRSSESPQEAHAALSAVENLKAE